MVTLLARDTVADVDEQLGHEFVTLLALVEGQLGPHDVVAAGHGGLRRWERRKTLVHHALLLIVIHKA
jgi:hypothetical protein